LSEVEFGIIICDYLTEQGFTLWKEVVLPNCSVDIVGVKDGKYYGFELKTILNDEVLLQCHNHRHYFHFSYAVILKELNWRTFSKANLSFVKEFFCSHQGIGIVFASPKYLNDNPHALFVSDGFRYLKFSKEYDVKLTNDKFPIEKYLFNDQKNSLAGSRAGGSITTFKRSVSIILELVSNSKIPFDMATLWTAVKGLVHWRSKGGMVKALRDGHTEECREIYKQIIDEGLIR